MLHHLRFFSDLEIIPSHSNLQLNTLPCILRGFEPVKDPRYPRANVYRHPMFLKGDWETCLKMKLPDKNDQQQAAVTGRTEVAGGKSYPTEAYCHDRVFHEQQGSTRRDTVAGVAKVDSSPTPTVVRSVTPQTSVYSNMGPNLPSWNDYRLLSEESATKLSSSMQNQAFALFQMGLLDSFILGGDLSLGATTGLDIMMSPLLTSAMGGYADLVGYAKPRLLGIASLPFRIQGGHMINATPMMPSDDEVRNATQKIVSAAIDALRPKSQTETIGSPRLDTLIDLFLERSMSRLSSCPLSIMGSRNTSFDRT